MLQEDELSTRRGIVAVSGELAAQQFTQLKWSGWVVFRLPKGITSRERFFNGVRDRIPLDPPLESNRSWDALEDSMRGGLSELPDTLIAVVWPEAQIMSRADSKSYAIAADVFRSVSDSLADEKATVGKPKQLLVLQVG